jgi:acetyl esterase/lipase
MSRLPRIGTVCLGLTLGLSAAVAFAGDDAPKKPLQAHRYPHNAVKRQQFGTGAKSYWLFEPAEPTPEVAPVVVFNHGWLATNPGAYGAWINHLVRRGNIVIFPRYQTDYSIRPADFLPNALAAIHDALNVLSTSPKHVRPDLSRFALIGHSAGANLAAQIAAVATDSGLPKPRALVAMMPGEVQPSREPSLVAIPATTNLVVVVAEDDRVVGDVRGRQIFAEANAIPPARKKFVFYRTDLHGAPALIADHFAPTAAFPEFDTGDGLLPGLQMNRAELNAFDHAGFWRLADTTIAAGFAGQTLDAATSNGELFRHLGYWSDGRPVERPIVSDDLADIPRVYPPNGVRLIKWSAREEITVDPTIRK